MSWWDFLVSFCGCNECAAYVVMILTGLAGLLADRGPRVSALLRWAADAIRRLCGGSGSTPTRPPSGEPPTGSPST